MLLWSSPPRMALPRPHVSPSVSNHFSNNYAVCVFVSTSMQCRQAKFSTPALLKFRQSRLIVNSLQSYSTCGLYGNYYKPAV